MVSREYTGKILLMGEYTTVLGGIALALPVTALSSRWVSSDDGLVDSRLVDLHAFLSTSIRDVKALRGRLDLDAMLLDIKSGLRLDSDIPQGYGAGSSGAITAAIYDRYCTSPHNTIVELLHDLRCIEDHYHGKSSGVDALVSYLGRPVVKYSKDRIEEVTVDLFDGDLAYYLLDTGQSRSTSSLVRDFLKRMSKDSSFELEMQKLSQLVDQSIKVVLNGMASIELYNAISHSQYKHLSHLIPDSCIDLWKLSMSREDIAIKLCGAGGGGYMLMIGKRGAEIPDTHGLPLICL